MIIVNKGINKKIPSNPKKKKTRVPKKRMSNFSHLKPTESKKKSVSSMYPSFAMKNRSNSKSKHVKLGCEGASCSGSGCTTQVENV